jgi:group I intron endonuclease
MIGIYKIINPNGKVYIGQSVRLQYRKNQYKNLNVPQQPKIYNSIKKYSWENHIFEVIEECSIEQLNERETYWKQYYLDQVKGDWNLLLFCGMYDNGSGPLSEETKQKISDALKGRQAPWSTPQATAMGKANKGKTRTETFKNNVRLNNSKPILQYDKQGNFIKEWECGYDAARYLNKPNGAISECCCGTGGRKSAYGYVWKFKK